MPDARSATAASESGTLALARNVLTYDLADRPAWRLPVDSIRLIGEYTTSAGPFIDDYFLVFVDAGTQVYEASCYAQGCDEVLASLGAQLDAPLQLALANSATWRSRVLWPPELADQTLLDVRRRPPERLREYIWTFLGLPPESTTLTRAVLTHLQHHAARPQ